MAKMVRTTIMADEGLMQQLRAIAKDEGISLGEVMRQGLEWRAKTRRRVPSFIGAVAFGEEGENVAARHKEVLLEYFRERDERERDARL
jgi:hypothetical protein